MELKNVYLALFLMINIKNKYLYYSIIFLVVFLIQIYFPIINIGKIQIQPDIALLYITVLSILHGRFIGVVVGFCMGLLQDFSTQAELLGVFSLAKPITAYCIGSIFYYRTIWHRRIQYLVVISSYLIHFFLYFYLFSRTIFELYYVIVFISIHSIIVFILFLLFNNLIYKNKLL